MKCAADKEDVLMLVFQASINPLVGANHDVGITTSKCKAVLPAYAAWCQLCIQRSKMFTPVQTHRGEDYAWLSEVHKWFSLELQHLEHVVLKGQIIKKNVQHYILDELVGALSPDIWHNIRAEKKHILLHFCLWLIQVTQTCGRTLHIWQVTATQMKLHRYPDVQFWWWLETALNKHHCCHQLKWWMVLSSSSLWVFSGQSLHVLSTQQ